jgi:transcriptional regulator GlxA family with amidase domain
MPLIRIWAVDDTLASGIAAPADVLLVANRLSAATPGTDRAKPFSWRIESVEGAPVKTASGQQVTADGPIDGKSVAAAIWLTGPFIADVERLRADPVRFDALLAALRNQHARGTLIATYCTGAFLLAEAGLLDGRVATTHWAKATSFRTRYPDVALRASDVLTEQDGILCSGAVTSYHNLALRLVAKLATPKLAAATAKVMLIDVNRRSQDPFVQFDRMDTLEHGDAVVARAQRWMERHLREPFSVARLSAHLSVSERTINRRFELALGAPPLKYLQTLRIEVAKRLLEEKRLDLDAVCERVGYADLGGFRQLFKRVTGVSPGEYRRRFAR